MIGTVLHTNEIQFLLQRCIQDLVLNKLVITFTAKKSMKFVFNFNGLLCVINMCICDVLLNFFVTVYVMYLPVH